MDLYEHKVLTTSQLTDLHFDSQRATERRLLKLYQHGVIQRFRPVSEMGSYPFHFLLGDLGAQVVAAELAVELKDLKLALKLAKDPLVRIAYSPRLGHLVALNTFFTRLIHLGLDVDVRQAVTGGRGARRGGRGQHSHPVSRGDCWRRRDEPAEQGNLPLANPLNVQLTRSEPLKDVRRLS